MFLKFAGSPEKFMRLVLLGSRFVFVAVLEVLRQEVEINSRRAVRHENEPGGSVRGERANFTRLVLVCIEADLCNQIFVGKLSPRSTQYSPLHRSEITFFSKMLLDFAK